MRHESIEWSEPTLKITCNIANGPALVVPTLVMQALVRPALVTPASLRPTLFQPASLGWAASVKPALFCYLGWSVQSWLVGLATDGCMVKAAMVGWSSLGRSYQPQPRSVSVK